MEDSTLHLDPVLARMSRSQATLSIPSNEHVTSSISEAASTSPSTSTNSSVRAEPILPLASTETPKPSRKRASDASRPLIKSQKVSEKLLVEEDCYTSKASLEKARNSLPKKHDIKLKLDVLIPYPFYRKIDSGYVKSIKELIGQKVFDTKRTTFTVCEDPASTKYLVLDGNHRVTALLELYSAECVLEFDCVVYGSLSKEQMFAICLSLTEPSMSLELRFLDQMNVFRKYRLARGVQRSTKVFDSQLEHGRLLVNKPNEYAIQVAQMSDDDYETVATYVNAFQNYLVPESPHRETKKKSKKQKIHFSNLTENGKLPDLKCGVFWKTFMKGFKINQSYTLSLLKPQEDGTFLTLHEVKECAKNQPQFLLRLKKMNIHFHTLEEASKALCDGKVLSDGKLMSALCSRKYVFLIMAFC
uniref:Uncharacterized protein n=1 Tax=Panagrolaimus superbus TaxID=310955 RepID=A0A914Z4S5_9BILA